MRLGFRHGLRTSETVRGPLTRSGAANQESLRGNGLTRSATGRNWRRAESAIGTENLAPGVQGCITQTFPGTGKGVPKAKRAKQRSPSSVHAGCRLSAE